MKNSSFWLWIISGGLLLVLLAPTPVRAAETNCRDPYTIVAGDTLSKLARQCGIKLAALVQANPHIPIAARIFVGETVYFPDGPAPAEIQATPTPAARGIETNCRDPYKIRRGDTLNKIAQKCELTLSALLMANPQIEQPARIYTGGLVYFPRQPQPVDGEGSVTIVSRPPEDDLTPAQIERLGIAAGSQERWIDVDLSSQTVSAYEGHAVVRTFLVSTGTYKTPTVVGRFWIYHKFETDDMRGPGYFLRDVPYTMYFHKGYGLHGTYWHSNFGTPMSHGCINLATEDAEWLFEFAEVKTIVNVHH